MLLLGGLVCKYIRYLKREKSFAARTIVSYESDLKNFSNSIGTGKEIFQISEDIIEQYFSNLELVKKLSPASILRRASTIRSFFQFLENENIILRNPLRRVNMHQTKKPVIPVSMKPEEIKVFFDIIIRDQDRLREQLKRRQNRGDTDLLKEYQLFCNIRNYLIFKVILETGLKPGELTDIKKNQLRITKSSIIIKLEHENSRHIELKNSKTVSAFLEYRAMVKRSGCNSPYFIFNKKLDKLSTVMVQKIFRNYIQKCRIKKHLTPSSLRHAYAIGLIRNNTDINTIRKSLGYKTFEGLLIYKSYFKDRSKKKRRSAK